MEKIIKCLGKEYKVRYFFDSCIKRNYIETDTGEAFTVVLGDIEGIEIYDKKGKLIGSFDYVDFDNNKAIRNLIENIVGEKA